MPRYRGCRKVLQSSNAAFSPLSIPGLALWLDATRGTYQSAGGAAAAADGDPVGQWQDQSGNARHVAQATSTKRGTLKTGIQNGLPVVRFDGVDDFLKATAFTLNQPVSCFLILKKRSATEPTLHAYSDGNSAGSCEHDNGGGGGAGSGIRQYAGSTGGSVELGTTAFAAICSVFNGASSRIRLNDGTANTGNVGVGNPGGFTLGATADGAATSDIDVAEILVYSGALSVSDETSARNYLNAKWAVY